MSLRTLDVALGGRSYPIHVGAGLLARPELWRAAIYASHILIVSDEAVATQYLAPVKAALEGARVGTLVLPPGEASKSLANLERVFEALAALGAGRDACLVALGGGVIGDLAGFAAATWMRGVDFIQIPTTLLAMVDSSVGGKTAVNLAAGKNLVGAFHQPRLVVADTATLKTLPPREYRAGLAEVVKYGAIGDAAFFAWLEEHAAALAAADPALLAEAIERSCAHKAAVVARDEHEQGERALLNFGHTFGHAYEALAGYDGRLLHGEAVAFGMVQAARLSAQLGRADAADAQRLAALLETLGLPVAPPEYPPAAVLERMMLDKKNRRGRLRLVLWRGIGRAEVVDGVADSDVLQALQA